MASIREYFQNYRQRQHVRPWALAAPILILLMALPLLRPLRHANVTSEEAATLTAVQSMVEHQTTVPVSADARIDRPVYVFLLAGPYWVMYHAGLRFAQNPVLVAYLLTVIGVTLPVAMCAGLIYRMGRLFELRRPWRMGLALACVLGSGLFSYATVLNAQAPAAFAVLWACACLIHVAVVGEPGKSGGWLALTGLLAGAAAVIEPAATAFLVLLPLVILAMRWAWSLRIAGVLVYAIGVLPAVALHVVLVGPDPVKHVQTVIQDSRAFLLHRAPPAADDGMVGDDLEDANQSVVMKTAGELLGALTGSHGLLSHFPVVLVAFFGIGAVMHRHWPTPTKMLAGVTAGASLVIVIAYAMGLDERMAGGMFASRWFIVFTPMLLFWCGAWLRRSHRGGSWGMVGTLLGFSILVSLIGATNPLPAGGGYRGYTAIAALRSMIHPGSGIDRGATVTTLSDENR